MSNISGPGPRSATKSSLGGILQHLTRCKPPSRGGHYRFSTVNCMCVKRSVLGCMMVQSASILGHDPLASCSPNLFAGERRVTNSTKNENSQNEYVAIDDKLTNHCCSFVTLTSLILCEPGLCYASVVCLQTLVLKRPWRWLDIVVLKSVAALYCRDSSPEIIVFHMRKCHSL